MIFLRYQWYDGGMNNPTIARILTGVLVLAVGVLALLDALNIISFWSHAGTWWPSAVIIAGLLVLVNNVREYVTAIVLIVVGAILQLNALKLADVDVWQLIWPVIIIGVGISILVNRTNVRKLKTQDSDSISAVLGASDTVNKSKDYQGGKINAILGGVSLDLRDATIKKEATIEVFTLCGGIELKVPRDWQVRQNVFPILGGVETKSHTSEKTDGPILNIQGTVALGGVEVHN